METSQTITKAHGQKMLVAERNVLIAKMLDKMLSGYMSTNKLAKACGVSRATIDRYRPLVDDIIAKTKLDRNVIRNLQVQRTYTIIEQLTEDLKYTKDPKQRSMIYGSIYKFSSHLALITGLNIETHVNIDPTKLVIIRPAKKKDDRVSINDVNPVIDAVDNKLNSADNKEES